MPRMSRRAQSRLSSIPKGKSKLRTQFPVVVIGADGRAVPAGSGQQAISIALSFLAIALDAERWKANTNGFIYKEGARV